MNRVVIVVAGLLVVGTRLAHATPADDAPAATTATIVPAATTAAPIPTATTVATATTVPAATTVAATSRDDAKPSTVPWIVSGAGGVLLVGGLATDLLWAQPLRTKLQNAPSAMVYNQTASSLDNARNVAYGMYGVGAAAAIAGVILHYTVFRGPADTQMRITGDTVNGGAVVQLEWRR